jgi:hypothetical protein
MSLYIFKSWATPAYIEMAESSKSYAKLREVVVGINFSNVVVHVIHGGTVGDAMLLNWIVTNKLGGLYVYGHDDGEMKEMERFAHSAAFEAIMKRPPINGSKDAVDDIHATLGKKSPIKSAPGNKTHHIIIITAENWMSEWEAELDEIINEYDDNHITVIYDGEMKGVDTVYTTERLLLRGLSGLPMPKISPPIMRLLGDEVDVSSIHLALCLLWAVDPSKIDTSVAADGRRTLLTPADADEFGKAMSVACSAALSYGIKY